MIESAIVESAENIARHAPRQSFCTEITAVNPLHVLLDDMSAGQGTVTADRSLTGTSEAELGLDTLNTVSRVDVLDEGELPAGSTALAGGNSGCGEEVFPDLDKLVMYMYICSMQYAEQGELTRNHLLPYFSSTLSLLPSQFLYQRHRVAE